MKTSTALKRTKRNLPRDECIGVCAAAHRASVGHIVHPIISNLLRPYIYLETWLWAEHGIESAYNIRKLQATRRAWLDHLVAHYESKGD